MDENKPREVPFDTLQPTPALPAQPAPIQPPPTPQPTQPIQPMPMMEPANDATYEQPAAPGIFQRLASGVGGTLAFIFSWFIFPILIVLILHNFVFQAYHVVGTSMVNTLHPTDYLIISKLGYTKALLGQKSGKSSHYIPERGQIVVFHYPKQPDLVFVKRVVALPNERVTVRNGKVTVYNQEHPQGFNPDAAGKYTPSSPNTQGDFDEVVGANSIFVIGDNRAPGGSFDSRDWGELPSSYIIGNAVIRLLPIDKITAF